MKLRNANRHAAWLISLMLLSSCLGQADVPSLENALAASDWYREMRSGDQAPRSNKARVGVRPFTNFGEEKTGLSGLATDTAIEFLTKSGRFRPLDISAIDEIRQAQNLALSGRADPKQAVRAGKLILPDVLMFGSVGIVDDSGLLTITLIDTETGRVTAKDSIRFEATAGLRELDRVDLDGGRTSHPPSQNLAKEFILSNWPWFWTVVLVPAALWLARRLRRTPQLGPEPGERNDD